MTDARARTILVTLCGLLLLIAGCREKPNVPDSAESTPIPTVAPPVQAPRSPRYAAPPGAQSAPFPTLADFDAALQRAVADGTVDAFWQRVTALGRMPLVFGNTAVFLYRGDAASVKWTLDRAISQRAALTNMPGTRQGDSDIWLHRRELPPDARLSYRIVLDNDRAIVDPLNPHVVLESNGPASELRMPQYVPPAFVAAAGDRRGHVTPPQMLASATLGYRIAYRVYTPFGYDRLDDLPVLYVTDGAAYGADDMGGLVPALDNLIGDGLVQPILAVLIDHRDPDSGIDRRGRELVANDDYNTFLATELVPAVDAAYRTRATADGRAVLASSWGAAQALLLGLDHADVFSHIAMQSPVWLRYHYLERLRERPVQPLTIYYSVGTIGDADLYLARYARDLLIEKGYRLHYVEVNDGHLWGNFRDGLDDVLRLFFGTRAAPPQRA